METREKTIAQANMVEFNLNGTTVKCWPENIAKYQALAAKKMRKPVFTLGQERRFPNWNSSMSTQQYVEKYIRMNSDCEHGDLGNLFGLGAGLPIKDFLPLPCRPSPCPDPNWKDEETEPETFAELLA